MRFLSFLFGLTLLLAGCSAQGGGTPTQTPPSAASESRSVANLKIVLDPKVWVFSGEGKGTGVEAASDLMFQGNGLNCQEQFCPRLTILKLLPSELKRLSAITSGTLPPCKNGSGKIYHMPGNDTTVGGLKAKYYSSDSCDQGEQPQLFWVVQEQRLIVAGDRMKDGYFPIAETGQLLASATWVS